MCYCQVCGWSGSGVQHDCSRLAAPHARLMQIHDLAFPSDGSEPLITKEQARMLLDAPMLESTADSVPGQVFVAWKSRAEAAEARLATWEFERENPHAFAEPPDPEVHMVIPSVDLFARALHMTDVDVMVFAAEVGEAQAQTGGKMLLERGPNVIAAVEKMWDRDEFGLRTKWMDHAQRALEILKNK